ncbi:uncharacterized protein LOC127791377 [Diospyros lotus]|uniref:uncharacterized protein LOC127791377 n=1 Tax=Diospyros lotus TaxID=55363 RepID=UPI00225407FD|nr:uncharacterized protein LOC127791377 [Diospyros lotus]XP_052177170.1 uncharacterized protein LOC127791377 [Diospyros lotus]
MAQRCSNSNGGIGNRSSRKLKQKRVPQRGLGVAQLERIREEEQRKKEAAAILSPNSLTLPSNSSSCFAVQSSPSFRPNPSIPNLDGLYPNSSVLLPKPPNDSNWPQLWNGEHNLEGENHRLELNRHGCVFSPNMNLVYESNSPIWPQPSSSSMVNVSSGTSSSSAMNYHQMEPPSNQSFYGSNNYTPMWAGAEKIVGMKRPCPFSVENPPCPSFPCKFPPGIVTPITRSAEAAPCDGAKAAIESHKLVFRQGSSSSNHVISELNPRKDTREDTDLRGDLLTLAPPTAALPHPSSKHKNRSVYLSPHGQGSSEFQSLQFQGRTEDPIQKTFQTWQATTTATSCNGEEGESLDLNLKL